MKLDKTIVHKVVVIPSYVRSICPNCMYRNLSDCNSIIYDTLNPLKEETPIKECYETSTMRVITDCEHYTRKSKTRKKVRSSFEFDRKTKTFKKIK